MRKTCSDPGKNKTGTKRMHPARKVAVLMCIMGILGLSGCGRLTAVAVQTGLVESPYYHLGDTEWDHGGVEEYWFNQIPSELNETYRELYARLTNYEDAADMYARMDVDNFWKVYYAVLADHPEIFWLGDVDEDSVAGTSVSYTDISGKVVKYSVASVVPVAERDEMRAELEAAADECIRQIPEGSSDYEKIRFVYNYIVDNVDYDLTAPYNQNVQSALLNRRSVCAGYSRAFQYILHRMGMFCTYVTGTIRDGGDHAWNMVRIDGEYYHVDVTWGDPLFEGGEPVEGYRNYNYLCCPDSVLFKTHTPTPDFNLVPCTDDSYDYYKLTGRYHETFDYDEIYSVLMNSVWSEEASVTMKFGSSEAYESAKYEMFSNGMLYDATAYLMELYGVSTWKYTYQTDDDFYLITIFW